MSLELHVEVWSGQAIFMLCNSLGLVCKQPNEKKKAVTAGIYLCACAQTWAPYQKGDEAPLFGFPLEAAVDVRAIANQDHDASLHSVKVLLQKLKDKHHCSRNCI